MQNDEGNPFVEYLKIVVIILGGGVIFAWLLDVFFGEKGGQIGAVLIVIGLIVVGYYLNKSEESKKSKKSVSFIEPKYPDNWDEIRHQVIARDNYQCGNCGSTINLHVHHIVPLSKGGTNNLSNLRTLCDYCHKQIHPHMKG